MIWEICLGISFALFVAGIVSVVLNMTGKAFKTYNPVYMLGFFVFAASFCIFIPVYCCRFAGETWYGIKVFLISAHNAIRLFVVDGEFDIIQEYLSADAGGLFLRYSWFAAVLFIAAPIITFSLILSFMKRVRYFWSYLAGCKKDCYIFSEINERSLTLAEDLYQNEKKCQIVFTDVFQSDTEESLDFTARAKEIKAVCFYKDILNIDFTKGRNPEKKLYFFIMGDNRSENLTQSLKLIEKYKNRENTRLFYFSDDENSDLSFSSVNKGEIKVKRVNMARVLIDRMLYEDGYKLFETAKEEPDGMRRIHAVIVGVGGHGSNMLRSLSWFCQMDGYDIDIHAFELDSLAQDKLEMQCPDLISGKYNGKKDPDEAMYTISIHPGVNVESKRFADEIQKLSETNYVIVSLGDDERNLRIAVMLRMLFERMGIHPQIRAIIYNSDERKALEDARNFEGTSYDISFFGDLRSSYSEKVIINSELEEKALTLHKRWADTTLSEEEKESLFWDYEYNYRSSIAAAIHQNVITEMEKHKLYHHDLDNEEHRRWNAYMRSEGYIQRGGFKEKDHLAKTHGDLVSNDNLRKNKEEWEKGRKIREAAQNKK